MLTQSTKDGTRIRSPRWKQSDNRFNHHRQHSLNLGDALLCVIFVAIFFVLAHGMNYALRATITFIRDVLL